MTVHVGIDRARSAARIGRDVETLGGPDYTASAESICRYAYTDVYRNTLAYLERELAAIGFDIAYDPVGTLVARNRPAGEPAFGVGSHCDSNRNGGKWDGTLGVVIALEVCRLSEELGLGLPLQLVSFLEEEASGFGSGVLGSRIVAQKITEEELRGLRHLDDGRPFFEHAQEAGFEPARWRDAIHVLDGLVGWIEPHIEQGRVLQDTGNRLGLVTAIANLVWADAVVHGRGDHAGATPMDLRLDPMLVVAECVLEAERLARAAGKETRATVGVVEVVPGLPNAIPERAGYTVDVRGVDRAAVHAVASDLGAFTRERAAARGMTADWSLRIDQPGAPMDAGVLDALEAAAQASGEPYVRMPSGACHDTMLIADLVPCAMLFVPCRDGISHSPAEDADPADGALAAEVMLNAIAALVAAS